MNIRGRPEGHDDTGQKILDADAPDACSPEHRYCGEDDLFGSGHSPETLVALALAYHAFQTGRRPIDETPTRAPAGETPGETR